LHLLRLRWRRRCEQRRSRVVHICRKNMVVLCWSKRGRRICTANSILDGRRDGGRGFSDGGVVVSDSGSGGCGWWAEINGVLWRQRRRFWVEPERIEAGRVGFHARHRCMSQSKPRLFLLSSIHQSHLAHFGKIPLHPSHRVARKFRSQDVASYLT